MTTPPPDPQANDPRGTNPLDANTLEQGTRGPRLPDTNQLDASHSGTNPAHTNPRNARPPDANHLSASRSGTNPPDVRLPGANRLGANPLAVVTLGLVAGGCVVNGFFLDVLPIERQLVFGVVAGLAYLHGRRVALVRGWPTLVVVAVPALGYCVVDFAVGSGALLCLLVFFVLPWLAGRFRRQQAALLVAERGRVVRLEQERALIAERVTLRERARIAAEMHDSLGHELALITLQAGALELSPDLPSTAQDAARRLRESAMTATDRLRTTVTVLRDAGTAPGLPHDESIVALVNRAVAAGMSVHLDHPEPLPALPPLLDRALHRVIQESLTNAARHAPGTPVTITLAHTTAAITATITNPTPTTRRPGATEPTDSDSRERTAPARADDSDCPQPTGYSPTHTDGSGSGLMGLREQARLVGGTVSAEWAHGEFVVRARFPTQEVRQ